MVKKIALIPLLYNEYNYGGVLQFYALQKKLLEYGFDVEILQVNDETLLLKKKKTLKSLVLFFLKPFRSRKAKIARKRLLALLDERIKKTDSFKEHFYCKTSNIKKVELNNYYAFVCGSDQIWNPNHARKRAFLSFAPKQSLKIIYAASLGVEGLSAYQKIEYSKYIQPIQFVSVREQSAKVILDSFLNRNDIKVVADPTLLLTANEWNHILEKHPSCPNKPYLFVYILGRVTPEQVKYISEFALSNDLQIVRILYASSESLQELDFGDVQIKNASPQEFLFFIKNASFILTDSFHACVFSLLFRKEFCVYKRDNSSSMMGRIDTLFNHFDINKERIIFGKIPNLAPIDYSSFEYKQNILIKESLSFLNNALNINLVK